MKRPPQTARKSSFLVSESQVNADGVHVWPFDPNFPVDVVQHSLSGMRPFRMNRHDYFELVYLRSGSLVWQVGNSFVRENVGELFAMTSPRFHRVTEESGSAEALSLFFERRLLAASAGSDFAFLTDFFTMHPAPQHLLASDLPVTRDIVELIEEIARELPAKTDRARLSVKTYVKMALALLARHARSLSSDPPVLHHRQSGADRMKPLFHIIEQEYREMISAADAAEIVHMSPSNFRRSFKELTGQSFVVYLNQFRVAKAQTLLHTTELPIAEVALEVGFCDQSYFGMIFRRLTQMTPHRYRQQQTREPAIASSSVRRRIQ